MPYNEKQKSYTMKYLSKLKEIRFRVKQDEYEKYEETAKNCLLYTSDAADEL